MLIARSPISQYLLSPSSESSGIYSIQCDMRWNLDHILVSDVCHLVDHIFADSYVRYALTYCASAVYKRYNCVAQPRTYCSSSKVCTSPRAIRGLLMVSEVKLLDTFLDHRILLDPGWSGTISNLAKIPAIRKQCISAGISFQIVRKH